LPQQNPRNQQIPNGGLGAIVLGAGNSSRMDGFDKVLEPILEKPIITYSLNILDKCQQIDEIVLVMGKHNFEEGKALVENGSWNKISRVCLGGARRQDSGRLGLECLPPLKWILIHDGARPCLDDSIVIRGLEAVVETGAAAAAVPVKDTIKIAGDSHVVTSTLPRKSLWSAQTPQLFRRELLVKAHASIANNVTDDASMIEDLGYQVKLFVGSYDNIKITVPNDIKIAELILSSRFTTQNMIK